MYVSEAKILMIPMVLHFCINGKFRTKRLTLTQQLETSITLLWLMPDNFTQWRAPTVR